ncbi:MAG: baseplate J/gp47 family protein [Pseudomonadota bacterium]
MSSDDCKHNTDPFKLVREGWSQPQRRAAALDPAYAPVDQRTPAHRMVFARAYSAFLRYFNATDVPDGDWLPFFSSDASVQLAMASIQDVAHYKASIKANLDFLDNRDNDGNEVALRRKLGQLFGSAATLAAQVDALAQALPADIALKAELRNLIQRELAPAFKSLLLYHRDGLLADGSPPPVPFHTELAPAFQILGAAMTLQAARLLPFSSDWISADSATGWTGYLARLDDTVVYPATGVYGSGDTLFKRVNHIATHNLFTSVFDRFLKVYARTVASAARDLETSFSARDTHEPHYALFLAFLRLFEHVRTETNTLTARHLDFYYREVLRLKEKGARPAHVHLIGELARTVPAHLLAGATELRAGKDVQGKDAVFAALRDTVLNQARVASLQNLYRHDAEAVASGARQRGRLFATPVANSVDGLGAAFEGDDKSWHPFHNKRYRDGLLDRIDMPEAVVGFAVASHYLLLAEGPRTIELTFQTEGAPPALDKSVSVVCLLTTAEGWLEVDPGQWVLAPDAMSLTIGIGGDAPAIVPYVAKLHGGRFDTRLPVLQIQLRHRATADYPYARLQDVVLRNCTLRVSAERVKSLSVSNDFGPVDTSKPFQPFGALPVKNSALIVGSKEAFQKKLDSASLEVTWQAAPAFFKTKPSISIEYLAQGAWTAAAGLPTPVDETPISLDAARLGPVIDEPDLAAPEFYSNASRHGFIRLLVDGDFGRADYQAALLAFLAKVPDATNPGAPRPAPVMTSMALKYSATQMFPLDSADKGAFDKRQGRFFHVGPFGQAEQHPLLNSARKVNLLPQFGFPSATSGSDSGAEFYIGVSGLQPPQNLNLLIEVAPGTADPLALKPAPHIAWSYLRDNEWIAFAANDVADGTAGLLSSGIATLAMPRDASASNTLMAPGLHWIRLSVASKTDAACRLLMVAAQAFEAAFVDRGNDPAFAAKALPAATIGKLVAPDAALKSLNQPFASFGGRGAEAPGDFYARISERLRHKDRAIALWDYEHLVLEAFPQIYKVKCLNHTQYQPDGSGTGIYRELAPGHVTIVTVPDHQFQNLRDPLRPYTSLDLLQQVETFLRRRSPCFVKLHVRNPQFEEVRLAFKVRLVDGVDESYHVRLLQEEITRFLSPWAFPGGAAPSFGGKVHKSVLINFVEERPYVDYLTDFQLFHDIGGVRGTSDLNEVAGSLAVSILVSAPAIRHAVEVLHPAALGAAAEHCPCEAT